MTKTADELEQLVTRLFDAVRYSDQMEELEEQADEMEKQSAARIAALNGVMKEFDASLEGLSQKVDSEYASQLRNQIIEFVDAAVEQAKAREKDSSAKDLSELDARAEIQKTKALKSLESYLASSPIPLMDVVLQVSLKENGYNAEAVYSCKGEISYRFSLSTQNSKFFHSGFTFAEMGRKILLPVELQRTWIRKEPSPRFEKLERYVLASAEASDRHIVAEFLNQETGARVRLANASTDGEGIPSVEYLDEGSSVNITTDTGLSRFLDLKAISIAMKNLQTELLSLERNKAALTELTTEGDDTLETLDVGGFLKSVLKLMGPQFRTLVQSMGSRGVKTKTGELSLNVIKERTALLGQSSAIAKDSLGLR